MRKNYTVNQAIWLAAAVYVYSQYKYRANLKLKHLLLSASDLIDIAKTYTENDINPTRIYQHCNGDHINSSNRYLRRVNGAAPLFRITYIGEYDGNKEWPEELSLKDTITYNSEQISISELWDFLSIDYKKFIKANTLSSNDQRTISNVVEGKAMKETEFDKNIILYGPPGTGKTYNTARYAVAICDNISLEEVQRMKFSSVMERYNALKEEGKIVFTTFHQSYGYEEFIEGIRPVLDQDLKDIEYTVADGIFKHFCKKAVDVHLERKDTEEFTKKSLWYVHLKEMKKECFQRGIAYLKHGPVANDSEHTQIHTADLNFHEKMNEGDILFSFLKKNVIDGIGIIDSAVFNGSKGVYRKIKWYSTDTKYDLSELGISRIGNLAVGDVKEKNIDDKNKLYEFLNRIIGNKVEEKGSSDKYVFIIDEINRGNISKIFGELITLIEATKRGGADEEMSVLLPYSGEEFNVPDNVYILGTMNTADRSIALMDTALRRRFSFIEMMPDAALLDNVEIKKDGVSINVGAMLRVINDRITFLYDREHTIGHAFFMKLINGGEIDDLATIFEKSVVPLLQEYFYDDYEKIRLVLGDCGKSDPKTHFIQSEEISDDLFDVNVSDSIDISAENRYIIAHENFRNIMSYKSISKSL